MKRILSVFLFMSLSLLILSCKNHDDDAGITDKNAIIITLNINYQDPTIVVTKAPSDCNVYFICNRLNLTIHSYGTFGNPLVESLPKGDYEVYTIVGFGSDLGPKTKAELNELNLSRFNRSTIESTEIYTNISTQSISKDATINIGVTRLLAKVDFNITVDPAFASNFTFDYLELLNVNNNIGLFSNSKLTTGGVGYDKESVTGTSVTKSFQVFENLQGVNGSITDQRHKTSGNAPSDKCTHLHVRGYSNGAKVDYYIYLGANNTNDFNLARNNHYIINTTIYGIDDIDNRVSVIDAQISEFEKATYELPEQAKAMLTIKSVRQNSPIYLSYQIIEGNGILSVDGTPVQPNVQHLMTAGDIDANIPLLFGQLQDGNVKLAITVTDNNGFTYNKEIATKYESVKELIVTATGDIPIKLLVSSTISLDISEDNYTDDFTIKYEVISGNLTTTYNTTNISSGQVITGKAGKYDFSCVPNILGEVKIKFTITDKKGQSKEIIKQQLVRTVIDVVYNITGENPITQSMEVDLSNYNNDMHSKFIFYFEFSEPLPCNITVNNIFVEFKIRDVSYPTAYNSSVFKLKPISIAKGQKSYIIDQIVDYNDPYCQLIKGTMTNCSTPYSYDGRALQGDLKLIAHDRTGDLGGELELVKFEIESAATAVTDDRYYFNFERKK